MLWAFTYHDCCSLLDIIALESRLWLAGSRFQITLSRSLAQSDSSFITQQRSRLSLGPTSLTSASNIIRPRNVPNLPHPFSIYNHHWQNEYLIPCFHIPTVSNTELNGAFADYLRNIVCYSIAIMGCIPSKQKADAGEHGSTPARSKLLGALTAKNSKSSQVPSSAPDSVVPPWVQGHKRLVVEKDGNLQLNSPSP